MVLILACFDEWYVLVTQDASPSRHDVAKVPVHVSRVSSGLTLMSQ